MFVPGLVKESKDSTNIVSDAGLICFEGYVLNPITQSHRKLPDIPGFLPEYFYVHILGLAVDRKTNEFRVFAQARLSIEDEHFYDMPFEDFLDGSELDVFRKNFPESVTMYLYDSVKNRWYKPKSLPSKGRTDLVEKLDSVVHANGCFHFLAHEKLFSYNIDGNFWIKIDIHDSPQSLEHVDGVFRWESLVQWQNRIFFIRTERHRDNHEDEDQYYSFEEFCETHGEYYEGDHKHTGLGIWEINPVTGQCVIFDITPDDLCDELFDELFPFSDNTNEISGWLQTRYGVSYNTMMIMLTRVLKSYTPKEVLCKEVLYNFETRTWSRALGYRHSGRELKARDFPSCIGFEPRLEALVYSFREKKKERSTRIRGARQKRG